MNRSGIARVIDLKTCTKEVLDSELRRATECLQAIRKERESLDCVYRKIMLDFDERQSCPMIDPRDIEDFTRYLCRLKLEMDEKDRLVSEKRKEVREIRKALLEINTEKRALEIYHAKSVRRETCARDKRDQEETDFMSITRRGQDKS